MLGIIIPHVYIRNMDLDGCSLEDAFATDFVGGWAGESPELEQAQLPTVAKPKRLGKKAPSAGAGCTRPETTAVASRKGERKRAAAGRADLEKYYKSGFSLLGNSSRSEEEAFEPVPENSAVHRLGAAVEGGAAAAPKNVASLTADFEDNLQTSLPAIQKMVKRVDDGFQGSVPAYFGADPNGVSASVSSGCSTKEKELAPFIDYIDDEDTYNFNKADYTASFNTKGYDKAAGAPLQSKGQPLAKRGNFLAPIDSGFGAGADAADQWNSEPSLLSWKNKDKGAWSSQFEKSYLVPESTRETQAATRDVPGVPGAERMQLLKKLDAIYARLDKMEAEGSASAGPNAQTETLLFVMSGLGLIFFLDLACRTAGKR
jgi:hypothetical protein